MNGSSVHSASKYTDLSVFLLNSGINMEERLAKILTGPQNPNPVMLTQKFVKSFIHIDPNSDLKY